MDVVALGLVLTPESDIGRVGQDTNYRDSNGGTGALKEWHGTCNKLRCKISYPIATFA